ncbi:MAG: helix-turn-helix transcriptional regulator [Candidatus Woesearchaeota archaeon]|nr:MAG: helix-turn-helix transcriptional regulator [Candidatus Woesearchaeota archaeon]
MGVIKKLKSLLKTKEKKKEKTDKESQILKEWREMQKKLENHPLTQAKIINEQLYNATKGELENLNKRVDDIDIRLRKVEDEGPKKEKKQKIKLTKKDKKVLEYVEKVKQTGANEAASKLKISRSNASLKLNRLYEEGFLEKVRDGKNVFYVFKHV